MNCCICKKHLTDLTSIKLGIGPVCRAKYGISGLNGQNELFNNHAVFKLEKETDSFVYIVDWGHNRNCRTVTNDVEWVLSELSDLVDYFDKKRVFYMDSDQKIDEIIHSGKHFISFKAGHEGVAL